MIDRERLRVIALSHANEDWWGFYELVWMLNTRYPDVSRDEKVLAAQDVLGSLFAEGLVQVAIQGPWVPADIPVNPPPGQRHRIGSTPYEAVEREQAAAAIRDPSSWADPVGDGYFVFTATPAGENAYQSLEPSVFEGLWDIGGRDG